jgi:ribosome-associated translation inhibitor RaiA
MNIDITAADEVPREELSEVRPLVESLERYARRAPDVVRVTLRGGPGKGDPARPYVADASMELDGHVLAAHAAAPSPVAATEEVVERLRRQLRRVVGADVALRNEPRTIEKALEDLRREPPPWPAAAARRKPPEERQIVLHRTYAQEPESTLSAIADLLDDDELFHLFVHVRTNEDVVVHWRDDGRIGLLFPRGSVLEDEDDVVVPEPSRYSEPLPLARARAEMDLLNHRFLYFVDAEDERGKVLYLRFDGDYGLVVPE